MEIRITETMMTALLVIQIMPVKYSIVKDQTPSSLSTAYAALQLR
jgi:hypothetical protein